MDRKGKFNHAFTIAFEVITDHEGEDVTGDELFTGLLRRIANLRENPDEIIEACGLPYDTFSYDDEEI